MEKRAEDLGRRYGEEGVVLATVGVAGEVLEAAGRGLVGGFVGANRAFAKVFGAFQKEKLIMLERKREKIEDSYDAMSLPEVRVIERTMTHIETRRNEFTVEAEKWEKRSGALVRGRSRLVLVHPRALSRAPVAA